MPEEDVKSLVWPIVSEAVDSGSVPDERADLPNLDHFQRVGPAQEGPSYIILSTVEVTVGYLLRLRG